MAVLITCSLAPDGKSATLQIRRNLKQSDLLDLIGVGTSRLGRRPSITEIVTPSEIVRSVPDIAVTTEDRTKRNPVIDPSPVDEIFDKDYFKRKAATKADVSNSKAEPSVVSTENQDTRGPIVDQPVINQPKSIELATKVDTEIDDSSSDEVRKRRPRTKRLDKVQRPIPSIVISGDDDKPISLPSSPTKPTSTLITSSQVSQDILSKATDTLRDGSQLTAEFSVQQRLGQKIYVISLRHDPAAESSSSIQGGKTTKKPATFHRRLPSGWEETKEQYFVDIERELERKIRSDTENGGSLQDILPAVRRKIASSLER